jgi:hypothetical protein
LTLTDSGRTPPVVVNAKGVEERSKGNDVAGTAGSNFAGACEI